MKREYEFLNLARFFGALWVLLFHANIHFGALDALSAINPILDQGVLGMTVFFVLSGFVLTLRYTSFDEEGSVRAFYIARVARLYPVYLLMGAATFPTLFSNAESYSLFQSHPLIWSMTLVGILILALQAWAPALFGVWNFGGSWSLSVEAFFYSTFPKLRLFLAQLPNRIILATILFCVGAMLGILVLLIAQQGEKSQAGIFYVLPIFRYPEFILGSAVYILCVERSSCRRLLTNMSIPMLFAGLLLMYQINLPGLIDFGFLFALPFAMLYVYALKFRAPPTVSSLFNYLGHISYCLYIVQFGTVPYLKAALEGLAPGLSWLIFMVLTFFAANLLYYLVEVPSHSFLRNQLKSRKFLRSG